MQRPNSSFRAPYQLQASFQRAHKEEVKDGIPLQRAQMRSISPMNQDAGNRNDYLPQLEQPQNSQLHMRTKPSFSLPKSFRQVNDLTSLTKVHLEKEQQQIQIVQHADTIPSDDSEESESSEEYKSHHQDRNEENQQFINSARRVNQNMEQNVVLSDEQLIQELRNRNIPLMQQQEVQIMASLQHREEQMLLRMAEMHEHMLQMERKIERLSIQPKNQLAQLSVPNEPQKQPSGQRIHEDRPPDEMIAEEWPEAVVQKKEKKELAPQALKGKVTQHQSTIVLSFQSLDEFNSLESDSSKSEDNQSQIQSQEKSYQSQNEQNNSYSFGPKTIFKDQENQKGQDLDQDSSSFQGVFHVSQRSNSSHPSQNQFVFPFKKQTTRTKSFFSKQSSGQLKAKNVDLLIESVDRSPAQDPINSSSNKEESKGDDDFFTSFQKQMEVSLLNISPANKLSKVPKSPAKRNKNKNAVHVQKQADFKIQQLDTFKSSPSASLLQQESDEFAMPVITISALEKKIDMQITGIREVQNESLSDYNQSLRSLGNKNGKQSLEKSIIKTPPHLETDFECAKESFGESDFTEYLHMENFLGPVKYSAEGIITDNSLQKSMVDFCVKVGVDPKYAGELVEEISKLDSPTKQMVFKQDFRANSRKYSENLVRNGFQLFEKANDNTLPVFGQSEMSDDSCKSLEFRKLQNLLQNNKQSLKQMNQRENLKVKMIYIQNSILAKRIQSFYDEETQRVKQMNHLQAIIQKQNQQIASLVKQHKAEKKELHFAFMFACPLVLSFVANNSTKLQMVPQLNYRKEFQIIKHKLIESKAKVTITSQQCTIESLQDVLRQKPLGIHFSGHGIQNTFDNVGEFHYQQKNEGDFLLLETMEGDSKLVSRQKLQHLISTAQCKLDFVVVATCHSEFIGRIFLEAGAQHVVCINSSDEVADEAVLHFTSTFYSAVFQQKESICKAFEYAQLSVKINHNAKEASVFKLLLPCNKHRIEETNQKSTVGKEKDSHKCFVFGPFSLGTFTLREPYDVTFKLQTTRLSDLVGRQKDMYILISKITSPLNHLITLMGLPGVGKSSLIKATMQYIQDRSLLRGGLILTDARSISNSEQLVRKMNNQFISENSAMFGSAKEHNQSQQQDFLSTFILIISKISYIKEDILLVIDNCDELILQDRQNFKVLISTILATVISIKIVLTTRIRLGQGINEANEEIMVLSGITNMQTSQLLKKKVNRPITQAEQNALLQIIPDFAKYPSEKGLRPNHLFEHHLFKLLGGNPQSIMLVSPLLNDPHKKIKLADLYKMLTSNQLCEMLKSEDIEDAVMASLRISVQISVQEINESDPLSIQFFFLLGQLPGGIVMKDLKTIWKYIKQAGVPENQNLKRIITFGSNKSQSLSELVQKDQDEQLWKSAINQLELKHLVESHLSEPIQHASPKKPCSMLFSSSESEEEKGPSEKSQQSLEEKNNKIIQMPLFVRNFAEAMIERNEIQFFQEILSNLFYKKLLKLYNQSEITRAKKKYYLCKITELINSLEQNMDAFIQRMSDKHGLKLVKKNSGSLFFSNSSHERRSSIIKSPFSKTIDDKRISLHELEKAKNLQVQTFQDQKQNSPKAEAKMNENQLWTKLFENYQHILGEREKNTQVMISAIELMTRHLTIKPQRASLSSKEWARMMWRWAFNVVQKRIQQKKKGRLVARINTLKSMSSFHCDEDEIDEIISDQPLDKEESEQRFARLEKVSAVAFTKGIIRRRHESSKQLNTFLSQVAGGKKMAESMSGEEMTVLYYIADLIIISRISIVKTICEKHLILMNKASFLFKANVTRYLAFCLMQKCVFVGCINVEARIMSLLEDSFDGFEQAGCNWGMGIAKYMMGKFYVLFVEFNNQSKNAENDNLNNSYRFSDGSDTESYESKENDREIAKRYFMGAIAHFEKINHFRGIVESGKHLMNLYDKLYQKAQHQAHNKFKYMQSTKPMSITNILTSGFVGNEEIKMNMMNLETQMNSAKSSLKILQSQLKHKAYLIRVEGEENNLISEVIRIDKEDEFMAAKNAIEKMTDNKKQRSSIKQKSRVTKKVCYRKHNCRKVQQILKRLKHGPNKRKIFRPFFKSFNGGLNVKLINAQRLTNQLRRQQ